MVQGTVRNEIKVISSHDPDTVKKNIINKYLVLTIINLLTNIVITYVEVFSKFSS